MHQRLCALLILTITLLSGCGGGGDDVVQEAPSKLSHTSILSEGKRAQSAPASPTTTVARVYQAVHGKALGNAAFTSAVAQIGSGSGFDWANQQAAAKASLSNAAFATLVLNNMSITSSSLLPTASFGTAQQAYDALQKALTDYLAVYAANGVDRGTIVVQLSSIIAGLEVDTTFGVYGAAATAFNRQIAANVAYSSLASNTADQAVSQQPPSNQYSELTAATFVNCPSVYVSREESDIACLTGKQITGKRTATNDACIVRFDNNLISVEASGLLMTFPGPHRQQGGLFSFTNSQPGTVLASASVNIFYSTGRLVFQHSGIIKDVVAEVGSNYFYCRFP